MGKFAIKGHRTRGCDVINILEMSGGIQAFPVKHGYDVTNYYFIDEENVISNDCQPKLIGKYKFYTLEDFEARYPLKVGDMVSYKWNNTFFTDTITSLTWDEEGDDFICTLKENEFKYYMKLLKKMEAPKILVGLVPVVGDKHQIIVDSYYEIKEENGKYYVVKKKPESPTTYEECCDILKIPNDERYIDIDVPLSYNKLLKTFTELIICRNAYWKIAGEQMGLDKPWEPTLKRKETHYAISNVGGKITYEMYGEYNAILVFPTKEMREVFHKHFEKEIEICKEFL